MHETFLQQVRREAEERRVQRVRDNASCPHDPRAKLKERIVQWYGSLPPEDRKPHYFMEELARHLRVSPQPLGLALRDVGWTCRRAWVKGQPYRHRWVPPH